MNLDVLTIVIGLLGGLALFLFGMDIMVEGLKDLTGRRLKTVLAHLTGSKFAGVLTGAGLTAIIQSSSVTTVILVGFVSAGLMSLQQSIAVILGADIGTTITAQIIAFKITKLALPMIIMGFLPMKFCKNNSASNGGKILFGLGLLFFGMAMMSEGVNPLRDYEPFLNTMASMANPGLGILMGAAFTAIIQSSSATTGIVIILASQGFVTLPAGIALILGANIGTCATALVAAIGQTREAVRAAMAHILIKIVGVLIWLPFLDLLGGMATAFSPSYHELAGAARMAAETPRQIANAHTLFNVLNSFAFIWFTGPLAQLLIRLIPLHEIEKEAAETVPIHLRADQLNTPGLALDTLHQEMFELGNRVKRIMTIALPAALYGNEKTLAHVGRLRKRADRLHKAIVNYCRALGRKELTERQAQQLTTILAIANGFQEIGENLASGLEAIGRNRLRENILVSEKTQTVFKTFDSQVQDALDLIVKTMQKPDNKKVKKAVKLKKKVNSAYEAAMRRAHERLLSDDPNRVATFKRETEILERLRQVYAHIRRIARQQLELNNMQIQEETADS